jgi:calcium/calmodulin-dependent protein kinase I
MNLAMWTAYKVANGLLCRATDQAALFESIMSGKYEYDEEYWSDISDAGKHLTPMTAD